MYMRNSEKKSSESSNEEESKLYFVYPTECNNRLCSSARLSTTEYSSDSSLSDGQIERRKRKSKGALPVLLAPVAFRPFGSPQTTNFHQNKSQKGSQLCGDSVLKSSAFYALAGLNEPPFRGDSFKKAAFGSSGGLNEPSLSNNYETTNRAFADVFGVHDLSFGAPPAIGVFWDIENCQVPKNKSATNVVQAIRERFCKKYREAEFLVVCDVKKERSLIIQDLHDAQVNLIHVQSTSKNAADEKLRQSLRRFAEIYQPPAAVVLISSDINFSSDLSELRYRKKLHVILVHNVNVADALKLCAHETHLYSSLMENVPTSIRKVQQNQYAELFVSNLPVNADRVKVRQRLKCLSDNCGGRVMDVDTEKGTATIRFSSIDYATRAQKRLKGEDVYGFKIKVMNSTSSRDSPNRSFQPRKMKTSESFAMQSFQGGPSFVATEQSFIPQHQKENWRSYEQDQFKSSSIGVPEANNYKCSNGSNIHDPLWRPQNGAFANFRNRQSLEEMNGACAMQNPSKSTAGNYSDEKLFYQHGPTKSMYSDSGSVDLIISNLDPSMDLKELGNILKGLLEKYVVVQNLNISIQPDGMPVATVKVQSQQEAQFAIAQLHHYKLGYKRITISYTQNNTIDPTQLREMVVSLLQEVRGNKMPLFKLVELLESRFHVNVSISEVSKLKDVCKISDDLSGRIISLVSDIRASPPSLCGRTTVLYCTVHCPNGIENKGWGEPEYTQLPNISMPFKLFVQRLNDLLTSHLGTLPLLSLPMCYEAEFGECLPIDENGVPLEHLVTCVNSVELKYGGPNKNIKFIKRELKLRNDNLDEEAMMKNINPSIVANIKLLCRELVDLLKKTERCQILLNRFIPFYHHHFGRQCRVANYGYTKLVDLLESQIIASVVQILGDGQKRTITLTHSTQMRRFTSDLLRVLKGQVSKQITVQELPMCYERIMAKPFNAVEYGLCNLEDLLEELPENTVVIAKAPESVIISIPKREQTAQEIMRTKQFADEVVKLLKFSPQCSMYFNKFVPAYHHHFGHQCKVSDYGFTKLIELFEAIPDTVKVEEQDSERIVSLTLPKALQVLGDQIVSLVRQSELSSIPLYSLNVIYLREFGYALKASAYDCDDVQELVLKLSDYIQIAHTNAGSLVILKDSEGEALMKIRVWSLLLFPPYSLEVSQFINKYRVTFNTNITVLKLEQLYDVCKVVQSSPEPVATLQPFYVLAAQIYDIICASNGQVPFNQLELKYRKKFGKALYPAEYDFNTLEELLSEMSFLIVIRGSRKRMSIHLNQQLAEFGIGLESSDLWKGGNQLAQFQWPPPFVLFNSGNRSTVAPPKPDTPPAPGTVWSQWNSPTKNEPMLDLVIKMPALTENVDCELFLPPSNFSLGPVPAINPPDPRELPMPDKLLSKSGDDSADSGVINNSQTHSENEMDLSEENNGVKNTVQTSTEMNL